MIERNVTGATDGVWSAIAAPLPANVIQWRQDGKPTARDGRFIARFVAFIDAQFVRERLDAVVPGEWDLTLTPLPNRVAFSGEEEAEPYAFTARLQILGVHRESVGQGKDYKTAETDAFKRAAVRFGIGAELYAFGPNWVQMDGDGKYAKPIEDPSVAYARRSGAKGSAVVPVGKPAGAEQTATAASPAPVHAMTDSPALTDSDDYFCPKCGGKVWDNRLTKRNPKAPDFKCRDRSCDGVIWPPKPEAKAAAKSAARDEFEEWPGSLEDDPSIPF